MTNLMIAFNAVIPMFLWMLIGYGVRLKGLLDDTSQKQMNSVVFKIFLPTLLFYNIYKTNLHMVLQPKLMGFVAAAVTIGWLLSMAIGMKADPQPQKRGALIQGMFRSNFILFGFPLVLSLFGPVGAGVTSMLIAIVIPLYNVLAVVTLELFRGCRISVKGILIGILKNPLIVSSVIGLFCLILRISLPQFLESTIAGLSNIATPLALVVMGAGFHIALIKENVRNLTLAILMRLVILPGIFITVAIWGGFRGLELAAIMVIFAAPTAVSSFPMAQQMGSDGDLAAEIVAFTTILSCVTIFLWIFGLKQLSLI